MIREEAIMKARRLSYKYDPKESLYFQQKFVDFVGEIYDDLEKQTCKNCIAYNEDEDACYSDDVNKYREMKLNDADPTFGCNKWRSI